MKKLQRVPFEVCLPEKLEERPAQDEGKVLDFSELIALCGARWKFLRSGSHTHALVNGHGVMPLLQEKLSLLTGFAMERFGARNGNTRLVGVGRSRSRQEKEARAHKDENNDALSLFPVPIETCIG